MHRSPLRRAGQSDRGRPPWWLLAAAAAFVGYFVLIAWTDLQRPAAIGVEYSLDATGMTIGNVNPGSPAAAAGFQAQDRVLSAGALPIASRLDWHAVEVNMRTGQAVEFEIARGAERQRLLLTVPRAGARFWLTTAGVTLALSRLVQLATLFVALAAAFTLSLDRIARVAAWLLATLAVFSFAWPYGLAANWRELPYIIGIALWPAFASSLLAGPILFSFFASFPFAFIRSAALWAAIWTPAVIVVSAQTYNSGWMVYRPWQPLPLGDWTMTTSVVTMVYVLGAAVALTAGYRRVSDVTLRRRVRVLAVGSLAGMVGVLPAVIAYSRGTTQLGSTLLASPLVALSALIGLALPLSFAYAALRHRVFDVSFIIRRSLQYALARRALLSVVPGTVAVFLLDLLLNRDVAVEQILGSRGWIYAGLAGFGVIARVRREQWLERLDRRFFRERYNAERLLRAIGDDVRRATNLRASATQIVTQIEAALHPEYVALLTRPAGAPDFAVVAAAPSGSARIGLRGNSAVAALLPLAHRPLQVSDHGAAWLLSQLPPEDLAWLERERVEMIVPVQLGEGSTDALFILGPRRSEEPYSRADEDLLMTVGHGVALLLRRGPAPEHVGEVLAECPACGRCYEPGTARCESDDAALVRRGLPRILAKRFSLERRIGAGGMGTVYQAADLTLNRPVAIKVIRQDLIEASAAARFQSEARLAASLAHPNVVAIHDVGVTATGRTFLVMELLEGHTVREELSRVGRLPHDRTVAILRAVASAVDAAHERQVIHRDLKPENVFLARGAGGETPKVLDFGLAKALSASAVAVDDPAHMLTQAGVVAGTPEYMAPERRQGGEASPDWDLWALAVVAFEMITGSRPFEGAPGQAPRLDRLPAACQPVFARALSADPLDRPTSAGELVDDIAEALAP